MKIKAKEEGKAPVKEPKGELLETNDVSYIVFTENELRTMSQEVVDKIMIIYGIDAAEELKALGKTRATDTFKSDLILRKQLDSIKETGGTPKGLVQIAGLKTPDLGFTTTSISTTINMGNYNSLKVESGLTLPVGYDRNLENIAVDQLSKQLEANKVFLLSKIEEMKDEFESSFPHK